MRENKNWVIGRILRDHTISIERNYPLRDDAVRISIYEADDDHKSSADAGYERLRYFGISVMIIQLLVTVIPLILFSEWAILMVIGAGTILALLAAAIPQ